MFESYPGDQGSNQLELRKDPVRMPPNLAEMKCVRHLPCVKSVQVQVRLLGQAVCKFAPQGFR